jgi:glycosyltransferase involved in cell wall biosynthesis
MRRDPLVSILVTNHNYGRFLHAAIDGALGQSYARTEVVVVDDGSTDASRQILAGYGDRLVVHLKDRGGHASAINAGVARCRGDLIAFLDSDDMFFPHKVDRVVEAHLRSPKAVLIYHQLLTMDALGRTRGRPWNQTVWSGDVRRVVSGAGGWWPRPTTSAMTFTRAFLERILPIRECAEQGRATWPDAYAGDLAPFFGELRGLREPLALYRVHGTSSQADCDAARRVQQIRFEYDQLRDALLRFGSGHLLAPLTRSPAYVECAYGVEPSVTVGDLLRATLAHPTLSLEAKVLALRRAKQHLSRLRREALSPLA